jgi:hypothetical protein
MSRVEKPQKHSHWLGFSYFILNLTNRFSCSLMPREACKMSNDAAATPVATFHMELQVLSDGSVRVRVECEELSDVPAESVNNALEGGFEELQIETTRIVRALREKQAFQEIMERRPEVA